MKSSTHMTTSCQKIIFPASVVGLTHELFLFSIGVLSNIQKFFDIRDSTAGLLQTGIMLNLTTPLTYFDTIVTLYFLR